VKQIFEEPDPKIAIAKGWDTENADDAGSGGQPVNSLLRDRIVQHYVGVNSKFDSYKAWMSPTFRLNVEYAN